jgi:hypothetical protein
MKLFTMTESDLDTMREVVEQKALEQEEQEHIAEEAVLWTAYVEEKET